MANIKFKSAEMNPDTGLKDGTFILSDRAVKFLYEVVRMYKKARLGDIDDPVIDALKDELDSELNRAKNEMNPS